MIPSLDRLDRLYVVTAFAIQVILLLYFALRKWRFETALRVGWIIYALAIPACIVSLILLRGGKPWGLWLGGFLFTAWAGYGFMIDIVCSISWRTPIIWPVFLPYVFGYLATLMFYWFPLGTLRREFWYIYAVLFAISSFFNITSHGW